MISAPARPAAAAIQRKRRNRARVVRSFMRERSAVETTGTHCLVELYDCPPDLLNDEEAVKQALRDAVRHGFADLLAEVSHRFTPQGITALGLLAESHISIHTWPEHGYAAADVFTCGERANAETACLSLVKALRAGRHAFLKLTRGTGAACRIDAAEPWLTAAEPVAAATV